MISPALQLLQMNRQTQSPLSQLGSGVTNLVNQKRQYDVMAQQQAAAKAQQEAYTGALDAWKADPSVATLDSVYANTPADKLGATESYIAKRDEATRKSELNRNLSIFGAIDSGDMDSAKAVLENEVKAYTEAGDTANANKSAVQLKLLNSDQSDALSFQLQAQSGIGDLGKDFMGKYYDLKTSNRADSTEERAKTKQMVDIYKSIKDLGLSDEISQKDILTAKELGQETLADYLKYASGKNKGTLTLPQYNAYATSLRKEFTSATSEMQTVMNSADKVRAAALSNTGFGSTAMITLFNKVLDPPSVVRESEAARTENSQAVFAIATNLMNKIKTGDALNPTEKQNLIDVVNSIEQISIDAMAEEVTRYDGIATRTGLDTRDVTGTGTAYQDGEKVVPVVDSEKKVDPIGTVVLPVPTKTRATTATNTDDEAEEL